MLASALVLPAFARATKIDELNKLEVSDLGTCFHC